MEQGTIDASEAARPGALDAKTMCEAFQLTAAVNPDAVALRTPGGAVEITWVQYSERVRSIAAGLHGLGVRRGDAIALMMINRPEFQLLDTAAFHLGATPFSIYNSSSPEQVEYLFTNAGNRVVVCERQFLDVIRAAGAPGIEHVVLIDGEAEGTIPLADLEARGDDGFDFEAAWQAVEPDDVADVDLYVRDDGARRRACSSRTPGSSPRTTPLPPCCRSSPAGA